MLTTFRRGVLVDLFERRSNTRRRRTGSDRIFAPSPSRLKNATIYFARRWRVAVAWKKARRHTTTFIKTLFMRPRSRSSMARRVTHSHLSGPRPAGAPTLGPPICVGAPTYPCRRAHQTVSARRFTRVGAPIYPCRRVHLPV